MSSFCSKLALTFAKGVVIRYTYIIMGPKIANYILRMLRLRVRAKIYARQLVIQDKVKGSCMRRAIFICGGHAGMFCRFEQLSNTYDAFFFELFKAHNRPRS